MLNIFHFLFFLFVSKKEEPTKIFDPINPFQKTNEARISFIYICLKTDNEDCNYFRKQCPPTNYNVLSNLINKCTKCQMNQSNLNLNGIKNQIKNSTSQLNGWTKYFPARIVAVCLTFILFNFLSIINIYVYLKVFNLDKYRRNRNTGDDENDLLLENQEDVKLIQEIKEVNIKKGNELLNEMKAMKNENESTNTIEKKSADKESSKTIEKKSSDKDKIFSHEKLRSFSDKYDQIYNLEASDIEECFEVVNKFNTEFMLPIIDCFKRKSIINEEMKLSLNCLFVSINIISKYVENNVEHHLPSIPVSDSSLVCTFDGFFDMISSHHLAESICQSILYTMCSLMKLPGNEVNKEFWKNKLEICFLNDKICEENKLASSVILVQLDISNNELMFQISEYLINKINFDSCQEYLGFTQSEIISASRNSLKQSEIQELRAELRDERKKHRDEISKLKDELDENSKIFDDESKKQRDEINKLKDELEEKDKNIDDSVSEDSFNSEISEGYNSELSPCLNTAYKSNIYPHRNPPIIYSTLTAEPQRNSPNTLFYGRPKIDLEKKVDILSQKLSDHIQYFQSQPLDLEKKVDILSQKLSNHIQYFQSQPLATHYVTIKFQREGLDHKHVKLCVHNNHNVVQVKQQIFTSLLQANTDDYKKIKLKYNGQILNDNDYLLKNIDSSTDSMDYIINQRINAREIVVVKLKCKMRLPEIIQIHKNESIENFLSTIGNFIRSEKFRVYKECIENNQLKLKELISNANNTIDKIVDYFDLKDGDILNVIIIECGELKLTSIFNAIDSYKIEYDNIDLVSTFSKNRKNDITNFIFFYRNEIMDENKFIFQFDISNDSQVKFCEFKRFDGITDNRSLYSDNKCEIYWATHKGNEKVLMKKYKEFNIKSENFKNKVWVLNELKIFLITSSHRRFVQLNGVYFDDNAYFYVSMENMLGGTLSYYLKNNKEFDSNPIIKWAAQILEGLHFLHDHKIIHRDLNPSSILVGENNYLKLSNFNLSKYNTNGGPCSILGNDTQLCYIKLRYMAPELLDSREYGFQCDVWSFGAVLVRIVTDKKPYPRLEKKVAQKIIIDCGKIEYEFPDKFDNRIKSIIDSCFGKNPDSRCTIKDLVEDETIMNSL